jgi:BirA family biotin operon repressor/biotin-[acetyl-CoA-carboxylase] ligase
MRLRLLADAAVRSAFGRELGRAIEYHDAIPSTQDRAREIGGPAVVVADHQTAGRGTRDRIWVAPAGTSLLASWVYTDVSAAPAAILAGVAIVRALDSLGVPGASLKWPNDVLIDGRKVAGAMAHASTGDEGSLVLGIGVNVRQVASDFPADLRAPATSLALHGRAVDRLALLARVTAELDRALADIPGALATWRERSSVLGRDVVVERVGEPVLRGVARDLDVDGALLLETPGGRQRIVVGEVSLAH